MSQFYAQMGDMHQWIFDEERAWSAMDAMADDPDHLGPADLAQLRVNLNLERSIEYLIVLNARKQLAISARLGIHYPMPKINIRYRCRPGEKLNTLPS